MKQNGASLRLTSFIIFLLLECSFAYNPVYPLRVQHFLQYLQQERQQLVTSLTSRSPKRSSIIGHMNSILYRTREQVMEGMMDTYILVPRAIISSTAKLHRGVNCSEYREVSKVYGNGFEANYNLRPTWLHRSKTVSTCPTQYIERQIQGPLPIQPVTILEAKCVCEGSQCSQDGSICVAVKYRLPVWISMDSDGYTTDTVELAVACACAKNPSRDGGYIDLSENK
ncbi:uncharacterized protein LOC123504127 [Portunus trituberculatus]|uniref:uncharacterized protein LOC123504127 n=1 Tax=Portunus trituberculatus TaxID=210409 RepID=UPI001E1CF6DF|nr:uncharacterized protein LOC123504127 [Portunus trituberculatus]